MIIDEQVLFYDEIGNRLQILGTHARRGLVTLVMLDKDTVFENFRLALAVPENRVKLVAAKRHAVELRHKLTGFIEYAKPA